MPLTHYIHTHTHTIFTHIPHISQHTVFRHITHTHPTRIKYTLHSHNIHPTTHPTPYIHTTHTPLHTPLPEYIHTQTYYSHIYTTHTCASHLHTHSHTHTHTHTHQIQPTLTHTTHTHTGTQLVRLGLLSHPPEDLGRVPCLPPLQGPISLLLFTS